MNAKQVFSGRLALQQRVLPEYRAPFFDRLAQSCEGGLSVYAGAARPNESIQATERLQHADLRPARNVHLLGGSLYLCLQPGIRAWLSDWDPEALVLEANPRYLSNRSAIRWMKARRRPVIGWGLGAPPQTGSLTAVRRAARDRYLQAFDALIAYSTLGADQYRQAGVPSDRVFTAPNAMSGPPPPLSPRDPPSPQGLHVLFVGRLQQRKRVDLLLQACSLLEPRPRLTIVGEGPARSDLERLAQELYPEAEFTGDQRGSALEIRFREADLFVLPGTGGLAVQQAMAYGLPVVVAEADGTQRDLVGAENGWLVPPGDLGALSTALSQALAEPQELIRKGAASHRLVAESINIETMVEVFVNALRRLKEQD